MRGGGWNKNLWKGVAYIPETPGVNAKEEKEAEFCSEVLILASTFQAAVGEGKKTKLHTAGNAGNVIYLIANKVRIKVDIPAILTFHTTEGILLLITSDNQC